MGRSRQVSHSPAVCSNLPPSYCDISPLVSFRTARKQGRVFGWVFFFFLSIYSRMAPFVGCESDSECLASHLQRYSVPQAHMASGPTPHTGKNKNKSSQGLKTLILGTHVDGVMSHKFTEVPGNTAEGRKERRRCPAVTGLGSRGLWKPPGLQGHQPVGAGPALLRGAATGRAVSRSLKQLFLSLAAMSLSQRKRS